MKNARYIALKSTGFTPRTETYLGREWTVVPVVALVETVIQALNSTGPELVLEETFSKLPEGWNGRPVYIDHPMRDGAPVSGNSPEIMAAEAVGLVFNAALKKGKLTMEAWLDNERAASVPKLKDMLERIADGEDIEISVGAYVELDDETGTHDGKEYVGRWIDLESDHLALLSTGSTGACSRKAGCGVRAAKHAGDSNVSKQKDRTLGGMFARIMQAFRGAQPAEEMSDMDIRMKIGEALREKDRNAFYPDAVYMELGYFVYSVYDYEEGSTEMYRRDFTLAEDGSVTVGDVATEVQPVLTYEDVVEPAEPTAATNKEAAAGAPCSCKNHPPATTAAPVVASTEVPMGKKEEALKFIEGATDEQLDAIAKVFAPAEAQVETPAAPAADAPAAPVVAEAAVVEETEEEYVAKAPKGLQAPLKEGLRVAKEKRAASIKSLKDSGRCDLTDAQLEGKTQDELDALVKLAGIRSAAVDYSAQGAPRPAEGAPKNVPAAPDMGAAIRAARGQK